MLDEKIFPREHLTCFKHLFKDSKQHLSRVSELLQIKLSL